MDLCNVYDPINDTWTQEPYVPLVPLSATYAGPIEVGFHIVPDQPLTVEVPGGESQDSMR